MKRLIKPTHGLLPLPGERRKYVPEQGIRVDLDGPDGAYWKRRISAGDAELVNEKSAADKKPAAKAKAKGK